MRFGCCVEPESIATIASAGFDFCELPARAVAPLEDDQAALPALRLLASAALRPEAFNMLVPGVVPLCGPHVDRAQIETYLGRAFARMRSVGGRVAVLGSGAARRIPEGWPRERALDQLAEAFQLAGEIAARSEITIAVEHLNRGECNVLNSIAECQAFLQERGLSQLQILADIYHLEVEREPLGSVVAAAPILAHVHVAGGGRQSPDQPGYDYAGLMATLHAVGYDARISAECGWQDLAAQAPGALAFMREAWAQA